MTAPRYLAKNLRTAPGHLTPCTIYRTHKGMATVTDDTTKRVLAANIQHRLAASGMSQRALARETGDPLMTINGIVRGMHMPGAGVLTRIAEALDTTVENLLVTPKRKSQKSA